MSSQEPVYHSTQAFMVLLGFHASKLDVDHGFKFAIQGNTIHVLRGDRLLLVDTVDHFTRQLLKTINFKEF